MAPSTVELRAHVRSHFDNVAARIAEAGEDKGAQANVALALVSLLNLACEGELSTGERPLPSEALLSYKIAANKEGVKISIVMDMEDGHKGGHNLVSWGWLFHIKDSVDGPVIFGDERLGVQDSEKLVMEELALEEEMPVRDVLGDNLEVRELTVMMSFEQLTVKEWARDTFASTDTGDEGAAWTARNILGNKRWIAEVSGQT